MRDSGRFPRETRESSAPENRAENSVTFLHGSINGFALDFTYVAGHSDDQCSKFSCGIPMLPASKAFMTIPMREDANGSR